MKFKDIEKNLKKESENIVVPDVYNSIKATPIHRLLTGETPIQAFKKELAIRVIIFSIVILIVAFFTFATMALLKPNTTVGPDSYVSFNVAGEVKYSFVIDYNGTVKLAVKNKEAGVDKYEKQSSLTGMELKNAINEVYVPDSTDDLQIYVLCAKFDLSNYWCDYAQNSVVSLFINEPGTAKISTLSTKDAEMIEYINSKVVDENNKVSGASDANTLIEAYLGLF